MYSDAVSVKGNGKLAISFHVGSQATNVLAWANAIESLLPQFSELERAGISIEMINLGGGYPFAYQSAKEAPKLKDIARNVLAALAKVPGRPKLILEPGRGRCPEGERFGGRGTGHVPT